MLEAAVDVLKVPLVVLGGSGVIMAIGVIISDKRRHGAADTSADSSDPQPNRGDEHR